MIFSKKIFIDPCFPDFFTYNYLGSGGANGMKIINGSRFWNSVRNKASTENYYYLYAIPKDDVKHIAPDISRDLQWQQDYPSEHFDTCG